MGTARIAANIVVGLCGLFSVLWTVCLLVPSGWHLSTVVFVLKFETGLYQVHVTKIVPEGYSEELIPIKLRILKEFVDDTKTGTFGLQEMRSMICRAGESSYCSKWSRLVFCSWAMLFSGICIVIFYWLAAGFMAYFWNANPTTIALKCSRIFLIPIPIFAFIGLALYFGMTLDFGDSQTLLGAETPVHYGASFFLCVTMVICSALPIFIFEKWSLKQSGEFEAYAARLKKYSMDDPLMCIQFGAVGPPPMYGSAPSTEKHGGAVGLSGALPPPSPYLVHKTSQGYGY